MAEQTVFSEMWKAHRGVILHSMSYDNADHTMDH